MPPHKTLPLFTFLVLTLALLCACQQANPTEIPQPEPTAAEAETAEDPQPEPTAAGGESQSLILATDPCCPSMMIKPIRVPIMPNAGAKRPIWSRTFFPFW